MKILFLTPQLPYPLDQGTKLRNYHLIRIAAEGGHEVDLLSFAPATPRPRLSQGSPRNPASPRERGAGQAHAPGARTPPTMDHWCRRIEMVPAPLPRPLPRRAMDALRSPLPDLVLRLRSKAYLGVLRSLLASERYDIVQVEGLELSWYLRAIRGAWTVFDDHNVEYRLQQRAWQTDRRDPRRAHAALYSLVQWRRLWRWEQRVCRAADAVLAVSERDAASLERLSGRSVTTVLNGIDLAAYPFRPPAAEAAPNLLFDGTMRFRPNADAALWFGREILPLIRGARPDARWWVVGRDPPSALTAFNFEPTGVAVTGAVPRTEPYWGRSCVYVLPMRMGGGSRFKALEAMARGVPIVSTALGMEGTPAHARRDYLRAEDPPEFAAATLRLLGDIALRRTLAASARRTVAAHEWTNVAPNLLEVYRRLGTSRAAVPSEIASRR